MPIFDLYHKRKQRAERAGEPDVYHYDVLPSVLAFQITKILERAIGSYIDWDPYVCSRPDCNNEAWKFIRDTLAEEFGREYLVSPHTDPDEDFNSYLKSPEGIDRWLSALEIGFRLIDKSMRNRSKEQREKLGARCTPDEAIDELNARFREHGVGYQFENGQIVRIDSELVHAEIVKPALLFLSDPRFAGPEEEYLAAHAHYRSGEYEDAIVDANNAFESTMRTVSELAGSPAGQGATASNLISHMRKLGLLPNYLESSFDQLAGTLNTVFTLK